MNTVYIINSLEGGGAERVFVELINLVVSDKSHLQVPIVILLDKLNEEYELPSQARVIRIGRRKGFFGLLLQYKDLLKLLIKLKPELIVSFLTRANIMNISCAKLLGCSSVISERSNTSARLKNRFVRLKRWLVSFFYRRANLVVAVSQGVSDCLVKEFGVSRDRVVVLYNPVDVEGINHRANSDANLIKQKNDSQTGIVAMGRLVPSKGFEDLIKAYKLSGLSCGLTILGDGPERERLVSLVTELELVDDIVFLGFLKNPHEIIKHAKQFVLCSHLEGFPNALLEAMALRIPVIATNCCDGPSEILSLSNQILDGEFTQTEFGLMVNVGDQVALAEAMRSFHENEVLRNKLASKAQERVKRYSKDNFYLDYSKLITRFISDSTEYV